jgi:ATP-dependent RNA helicase DeaD
VDELNELLLGEHFGAESIHSDIKQSQRTSVMYRFKQGRTSILIATDIAARGIDVSDVDFVINFDIPANSEYYVHRIGRTGRAGKSGRSITLCSGKREVITMRSIASAVKSVIARSELPTADEIQKISGDKLVRVMEESLQDETLPVYVEITGRLIALGYSAEKIAAAAIQLNFAKDMPAALPQAGTEPEPREARYEPYDAVKAKIKPSSIKAKPVKYETILIDIGSNRGAAVNHIIGAITERSGLSGREIGKVDIFPDQTVVEIPAGSGDAVLESMTGCKITGRQVTIEKLAENPKARKSSFKPETRDK